MATSHASGSTNMLDVQLDWIADGADVAARNVERMWRTQLEGCRDWMEAMTSRQTPPIARVECHLDQSLHLGCQLFVVQVAAFTDGMYMFERAVAETQRNWLTRIDSTDTNKPVRSAVCFSGSAYDSMSKATRQVANFASNRFSAAAVSAFQQARDCMVEAA